LPVVIFIYKKTTYIDHYSPITVAYTSEMKKKWRKQDRIYRRSAHLQM